MGARPRRDAWRDGRGRAERIAAAPGRAVLPDAAVGGRPDAPARESGSRGFRHRPRLGRRAHRPHRREEVRCTRSRDRDRAATGVRGELQRPSRGRERPCEVRRAGSLPDRSASGDRADAVPLPRAQHQARAAHPRAAAPGGARRVARLGSRRLDARSSGDHACPGQGSGDQPREQGVHVGRAGARRRQLASRDHADRRAIRDARAPAALPVLRRHAGRGDLEGRPGVRHEPRVHRCRSDAVRGTLRRHRGRRRDRRPRRARRRHRRARGGRCAERCGAPSPSLP